jgi:L-aminopeptidase/D-esterase-like protein
MRPGDRNAITDVAGLLVGNAAHGNLRSGVTAILCETPATASVHVSGGAPGTRETDLLSPENTVQTVNAIVLSGGSAFGLDAASGVQAALRERRIGLELLGQIVPIVPAAILFDMANNGDKDWGRYPPYRELGYQALDAAAPDFATGTAGAGYGALVAGLKGGLGTASTRLDNGMTVGALVAVNALGSPTIGDTAHFWSAPFEMNNEFGGLGWPAVLPENAGEPRVKFRARQAANANTTIAVIATDAKLSKEQAKRLAISAHDGFARALWPSHTPLDGDLVFALATGRSGLTPTLEDWIDLGAHAASTMARAIAQGIYEAEPAEGDLFPAWRGAFSLRR